MSAPKEHFWTKPNGVAAIVLIVAVAYLLLTEHRAHVIAALPWLIFLSCPLMHVFMHRGHGHHHDGDHDRGDRHRHADGDRD
jgi:hypothetical protein